MLNLLNEASDIKFVATKCNLLNDQSDANYDVEKEIICKADVLKPILCD